MRMDQGRRRWGVLATAGLAQLMVVLDSTVVTIALPSAQESFEMSDASRSWVVTAYALTFGGLLLVGGRLSDLLGARRAFVSGLIGFAAASALAGIAPTAGSLFAGRAAQGIFAAVLAPAGLSLVSRTFTDPRERGTAFGVFGGLTGAGGVVGLLLGGVLTEYADWRWCLLINVPIAGVASLGAVLAVPAVAGSRVRVDVVGAVTSVVGMAGVVFALAEGGSRGWTSAGVVVPLGVGLVCLVGFVLWQRRSTHPLLPLGVVLERSRGSALLAVGLPQLAMFGFFLVLTYWFQQILGFSPLGAGLAFLPLGLAIGLGSTVIAGQLAPRLSPRTLIVPGLAVMALGTLLLVGLDPGAPAVYWTRFLPAEVLIGVGLGCSMTSAISTATSGVGEGETGVTAAVVNAVTQLGGSLGTALLNTVAAVVTSAALDEPGNAPGPPDNTAAAVAGFDAALLTGAGLLAATTVLVGLLMPRRIANPAGASSGPRTHHEGPPECAGVQRPPAGAQVDVVRDADEVT
jgi:EmrB/QacA subfamily drug resistance transporter